MNTLIKTFWIGSLLVWGLSSCSSELDVENGVADRAAVFTTSSGLRATGTSWTAGDCIGVFMKASGTALEGASLTGNAANVSYTTTTGNGLFEGTSQKLYYPQDGSKVDFVAYYPYTASTTDGVCSVSIADQSDPEDIDLMYADNLQGLDRTSATAALSFSHQLAQVELTLNSADGTALDGMTATLTDVPTTASFSLKDASFSNLADKADVAMNISGSGTSLTATAFLIPNASLSQTARPLSVTLTSANGKTTVVTLAEDSELEKGNNYTYTLSVKNSGTDAAPAYAHWTETPTITAAQLGSDNLKYVTHYFTNGGKTVRNYSYLYDTDLKMAYWVAYPLCNYYTKSNVSRTDLWAYDPALEEAQQACMKKGLSGNYDRGHQIPSADRLVTTEANEQTFYYTNMTPQVGKLNQQVWASLESQVRNWSSNIDTLYVVTGAMPSAYGSTSITYTTDNNGVRIAVPAYYFKALARIDRETGIAYTIAFTFPNEAFSGNDYMSRAISVAALEEMTGFTFFPDIDAQYKQTVDTSKWNSD